MSTPTKSTTQPTEGAMRAAKAFISRATSYPPYHFKDQYVYEDQVEAAARIIDAETGAADIPAPPKKELTLRDYFAARAPLIPKEILLRDPWVEGIGHFQCLNEQQKQAWWAYQYADAMIAARTTTP